MHRKDIQRLLKREEEETGEQFVAFKLLNEPGRFLPLVLQVYEAEQLTAVAARPPSRDNELVGGVEVNKFTGRAVAYWFEDSQNCTKPIRVAAEELLHDFEVTRVNQVRGVSAYALAVLLARGLDDYIGAEVDAAKLASKFLATLAIIFRRLYAGARCQLKSVNCQPSFRVTNWRFFGVSSLPVGGHPLGRTRFRWGNDRKLSANHLICLIN